MIFLRMYRFRFVFALALVSCSASVFAQAPESMIDTYGRYELRIRRMESIWPDVRAVTAAQPDGGYATVLFDRQGKRLPEVRARRIDPLAVENESARRTLSRANETMERDYRRVIGGASVKPERVVIDFGEFVAESIRDTQPRSDRSVGPKPAFHTLLTDVVSGEALGILEWYEEEKRLEWSFPRYGALGRGSITPEVVPGETAIQADMVWAGIQALVFRDSYEHVQQTRPGFDKSGRPEIRSEECDGEPDGCTGMHWLDGTVYRACCDAHDRCYEYDPPDGCCTAWSWIFPYSWRCMMCNVNVVRCFFTVSNGGPRNPLTPYPNEDMTPIVIDLGRDGFDFTPVDAGVVFDLNADGVADRTSWTTAGAGDAFLALDRNNDGVVNDGRELFGSSTPQDPSPQPNGFIALAFYDSQFGGGNQDGVISADDDIWASLLLWHDANQNGISEATELIPAGARIASIDLHYRSSRHRDAHGNELRYRSSVQRLMRKSTAAVDVIFVTATP